MESSNGQSPAWNHWLQAESALRALLGRTHLPTSSREEIADRVLILFLSCWLRGKERRNPRAWLAAVTRKQIWAERRAKRPFLLGGDLADVPSPQPPESPQGLPEDPWNIVVAIEANILSRLTPRERQIFAYLREHRSLQGCARQLAMSARDVRTRFRRICQKLEGILADAVPPPLLMGRYSSRRPSAGPSDAFWQLSAGTKPCGTHSLPCSSASSRRPPPRTSLSPGLVT